MGAERRDAAMEVTVYEVTDEAPPWRVSMRHVSAERGPVGLVVAEMLVVENPADKTWLGASADAQNRRTTVNVSLPPGAMDIDLGAGFHGWCCTAYAGGTLNIQMPLMPGRMTYKFAYRVPESPGGADLRVAAPAPMDQVVFMLADDGTAAQPTVVQPFAPGTVPAGGRMFQASAVAPNTPAGVVLASLPSTQPLSQARGMSAHAKIITGAVAGLVLIGGVIMLAVRRSAAKA